MQLGAQLCPLQFGQEKATPLWWKTTCGYCLLIIRKLITVFSATSTSRVATQANKPDRHDILSFLHFIYIPSSIITSRLILVAVIPTEWQSVSDTHSDKGSNVTQMLYSSSPNHDFRRRQNKQAWLPHLIRRSHADGPPSHSRAPSQWNSLQNCLRWGTPFWGIRSIVIAKTAPGLSWGVQLRQEGWPHRLKPVTD